MAFRADIVLASAAVIYRHLGARLVCWRARPRQPCARPVRAACGRFALGHHRFGGGDHRAAHTTALRLTLGRLTPITVCEVIC
jgi:hypothetical protein